MKKETLRDLYIFVRAARRLMTILCSVMALVMLVMVMTTATSSTFTTAAYVTSPAWLMYFISKGAELILEALYH